MSQSVLLFGFYLFNHSTNTKKAKQITLLMADTLKWVIFNTILIKKTVCALFVFFTSQIVGWYFNQRATSYELRVTSYELISLRVAFIARVMSYFLHTSNELLFIAQVTSYFLHMSYELLFIARFMSYFLHTSYELLFTAQVTS